MLASIFVLEKATSSNPLDGLVLSIMSAVQAGAFYCPVADFCHKESNLHVEFLNPTHTNLDETCVDKLWYMVG